MERITISVSHEFAAELAAFMATNHYENRSEALRDLARRGLDRANVEEGSAGDCVVALSYVYNHHTRELSRRLTEQHHAHHDIEVATMHVHLDHDSCLEVAILRGWLPVVREVANAIIAERGVTHGQVHYVPVVIDSAAHGHGPHRHGHSHPHTHTHTHPRN